MKEGILSFAGKNEIFREWLATQRRFMEAEKNADDGIGMVLFDDSDSVFV